MISVIVPVYHVEEYLRKCLDSILGQTYRGFELILVNDGGTASETAICEEYAAKDPRVVYRYQENAGLSAARNSGLSAARGEWVQFADSDDWLEPDMLEKLMRAAEETGADVVLCDAVIEAESGSWHDRCALAEGVYTPEEILTAMAVPRIPPNAWNKFARRVLYDGVRFPEGQLWEDAGTMHLPVSRAKKICVLPEGLYHYRQRTGAITEKAVKDGSVWKWRFIQYRRRYLFLKECCEAAANAAVPSLIGTGVRYWCRLGSAAEDRREAAEVRRFLLGPGIRANAAGIRQKGALICLRFFPPVIRLAARWSGR